MLNLLLNIVIPSVILTKFSNDQYFGQVYGLLIALAFPISYGVFELIKAKKLNFFSVIGLVSVLLTGGIGLFATNRNWMIAKETAIPLLMGLAVLISERTKTPFMRLFFSKVLDLEKIQVAFHEKGKSDLLDKVLTRSSYLFGFTFFISAALNYGLADYILVGQPGTEQFNESLGKMTALSFPVITLPMMVMVLVIITYLLRTITKTTELSLESVVRTMDS